jgi:penicillin-binding protein 1A
MVAMDPRTGDIRAIVGGRLHIRGALNRAVRSRRQPGSAFKPFVYAAALSAGLTPASLVDDVPLSIDQGNGDEWTPANYGDEYAGTMTLRKALMRSSNSAAVAVSRTVGEGRVVNAARELVTAYSPFANGGNRVKPRLVRRIEKLDGTVLWSSEPETVFAMDARDAFQMTSMLRGVIDGGTGSVVRALGVYEPVAGKTGTTNDGNDTWFVGYTPAVVAGFWFGYDTPKSLGYNASGARMAAPAWVRFYREGWKERAPEWRAPSGMVEVLMDLETGQRANEWCPIASREWFRVGSEPVNDCHEHALNGFTDWVSGFENEISEQVARILKRLGRGRP